MAAVSTAVRSMLLALVLTALPVGAGLLLADPGDETEPVAEPPAHESTPLASYDTASVVVARAGFCDRIPEEAVAEALDGRPPRSEVTWGNGEPATVVPGVEDVAHEYGCRFEGGSGTEARAWVFTPPVTRERAADLVAEASRQGSCERRPDAPAYGDPSVALVCPSGDRRFASFRGLFGDAWLACSVAAPADLAEPELLDRAGRWCVAVAEAASTG